MDHNDPEGPNGWVKRNLQRHIDGINDQIRRVTAEGVNDWSDEVMFRHPGLRHPTKEQTLANLNTDLTRARRRLQETWESDNSPRHLRALASSMIRSADLRLEISRRRPEAIQQLREREAEDRIAGRQAFHEAQRVAEAQRELTRGLRTQELPPAPRPPEEEPGRM